MVTANVFLLRDGRGRPVITDEGRNFLDRFVTNQSGRVYGFRREADPLVVAGAMARLSRRGSDLREILLDEFAVSGVERGEELINRVVTEYGDDSVSQLISASLVVEGASNLLTKILEWGRLMAYLEQSTRYIYFDEKDENGRYKYFLPGYLPEALKLRYVSSSDFIFETYSGIVRELTAYVRSKHPEPQGKAERAAWLGATRAQACDAARPTLPVATKSTVGIVGTAQSIDSLVRHLFASTLPEASEMGYRVLEEMRKVIPAFLKRTDVPSRGMAWAHYMHETAATIRDFTEANIPKDRTDFKEGVMLVEYFPKDELELLPRMLHASSSISLPRISREVGSWDTDKKEQALKLYFGNRLNRRHKPGRAIEYAHYEFEVCADYGTFRDLQRHRMVDEWEWQNLTPDYGFDVPQLVVEAGLESKFRECFARSEKLFEALKDGGYPQEAQYATLLGHRMRYRFMINAREAFHMLELRTQAQGHPGYRRLCQEMHREIAAVHPRIAGEMRFVNQNGDPELTRIEAERATQMKLELIGRSRE